MGLFDALWYSVFPPDSALEFVIDQLPDVVLKLSKTEPFICGFVIILSLGLTCLVCMPIDIKFNGSKIFEIKTFFEYFKIVAYFPIMIVVGTLILWLPIKIFGRIIGYLVYPFEWIASFILGIVYNIISPFFK
ncbi:MAG: hypothetical protein K6C05_02295 [Anaerovibrio sp.]|uniref:hypothetical protein n=1 Tax=Selenomonadaceae TaxID=1843491 RepID=UPI002355767D|nr:MULTISPECIES: hypothetical protein [Selenomonadaceae]MBE6097960.1 hypothetical protein [Schwartzia succinivorans]MCR5175660.1 hypothetical protein [Anaerovibrio sp.]